MDTVAQRLERLDRDRLRRMIAEQRVAEALALGDAAIADHAATHRLSRDEARRRLEHAAQAGRRPSRVARDLIG